MYVKHINIIFGRREIFNFINSISNNWTNIERKKHYQWRYFIKCDKMLSEGRVLITYLLKLERRGWVLWIGTGENAYYCQNKWSLFFSEFNMSSFVTQRIKINILHWIEKVWGIYLLVNIFMSDRLAQRKRCCLLMNKSRVWFPVLQWNYSLVGNYSMVFTDYVLSVYPFFVFCLPLLLEETPCTLLIIGQGRIFNSVHVPICSP